jgi:hypothetical protein
MRKTWTWILGIPPFLVILADLGVAGYRWGSRLRRADYQGLPTGPSFRALAILRPR